MRGIPKEQIITRRYEREVVERKNHMQTIQVERDKAQKDLISLKAEILACIKGESVFPKETLAEMITAQEENFGNWMLFMNPPTQKRKKLPN